MTRDELRADLVRAIVQYEARCEELVPEPFDGALVRTYVAPSSRSVGVRLLLLERLDTGNKLYGVTYAAAHRWLKRLA